MKSKGSDKTVHDESAKVTVATTESVPQAQNEQAAAVADAVISKNHEQAADKPANDGAFDWKSLIPKKYFYINPNLPPGVIKMIETKHGCSINEINLEEANDIDDSHLILTMRGIKYVARLHGFSEVTYRYPVVQPNFVVATCRITFLANPASGNRVVTFEDSASATRENTNDMGYRYIVETATNRAFCRCVRNFLGINVVTNIELMNDAEASTSLEVEDEQYSGPYQILFNKMESYRISFETLINALVEANKIPADHGYKSLRSLPPRLVFTCLQTVEALRNQKPSA